MSGAAGWTLKKPGFAWPLAGSPKHGFWSHLVTFIIGGSVAIDIPLAGHVMGPDFFCPIGLLFLAITGGGIRIGPSERRFAIMLGLWFAGAVLTDAIRATPVDDVIRGWSRLLFFGTTFFFVSATAGGRLSVLLAFLIGLYAGGVAKILLFPSMVYGFDVEPWKFGFGPAVTFIPMAMISTKRIYAKIGVGGHVLVALALAGMNLVGNSRSIFGLLLAAAATVVVARVADVKLRGRRLPPTIFAIMLLGGGLLYNGISDAYSYLAADGTLGVSAQQKYADQEQLGLGLLLGGRVESLVSTRAIADSPIVGHGSWARDINYQIMLSQELQIRGRFTPPVLMGDDLIPSHSYLFGAWVESGVLGGIFWIYVLVISLLATYSVFHLSPHLRLLVTFLVLDMIWNVLFSPFGAEQRFFAASKLLILMWTIRESALPFAIVKSRYASAEYGNFNARFLHNNDR